MSTRDTVERGKKQTKGFKPFIMIVSRCGRLVFVPTVGNMDKREREEKVNYR